jgi:twitching motility protein PilT
VIQSGLSHYLFDAIERGASDLHVTVGLPSMVRVKGEVRPLDYLPLTPNATRELIYDILSIDQRQRPENEWELDFSYAVPNVARFRVNVYIQRDALGAAFRTIPHEIKSLAELGLPKSIEEMTKSPEASCWSPAPQEAGSPQPSQR